MAETKPKTNERLRSLLFDSGEQNMNLTSLRDRVEDLSNRIDSVTSCLTTAESVESKWKAGLDAYILLNVQMQQLMEDAKSNMKSYAVCPVNLDHEGSERWPELLATMLHPEQESATQCVKDESLQDEEECQHMIESIDRRNETILDLIKVSRKPGSGLLDPKGPTRKRRNVKSAEMRHLIRRALEKDQQIGHKKRKLKYQKKRLTVCSPDAQTGFGVLTNAILFGFRLSHGKEKN